MSNDLVIRRLSEQVSIDASDLIAKLSGLGNSRRRQESASCFWGAAPGTRPPAGSP